MIQPGNSPTAAVLTASASGGALTVEVGGEWSIHLATPGADAALKHLEGASPPSKLTIESAGLESYDSSLISCLLTLERAASDAGASTDRSTLPDGVNDLLDMALAVPEKRDAHAGVKETKFFSNVGTVSIELAGGIRDLFNFIGQCVLSLGRLITGRARFRKQDMWVTIQECGSEALPIVSLINLLIGMILAFVGSQQLGAMGASIFVADLVALAMTREMAAIMTGIIMSGRTGAAFAAQIGSMKTNQEIDALKTFGLNEIDYLVLPRILALIIMMPLLTVYANALGMVGGMIVGVMTGLSFQQYYDQTLKALTLTSCGIGVTKSIVFGIIIAAAGCLRGLQCGNSASAVGTAATSAVVTSITVLIIMDAVFAVLLSVLGI